MTKLKRPAAQKTIEVILYILIGFSAFGAFLDAISNAVTLFTLDTSIILSIIIIAVFSIIILLVKYKKIQWLSKDQQLITITKIGPKIILPTIGILILIWIPSIIYQFHKPSKKYSIEPIFAKNDTTHFKILLLPFSPDIKCTEIQVDYKGQIVERLSTLKERENLDIKVLDIKNYDCPKTTNEAVEIGNHKNADLVIWGSYEENELFHKPDKIRLRYALLKNFEIDTTKSFGDTEMQELKSLSQLRSGYLQENIDFIIYWVQGMYFYKRYDLKNSYKYFNKILQSDQSYSNYESFYRLSEILYDLGEYKNALNQIKKYENAVLKEKPVDSLKFALALSQLGIISAQMSDFKTSLNSLKKSIDILKTSKFDCKECLPVSLYNYALANLLAGNFEQAEKLTEESSMQYVKNDIQIYLCNNYQLLADIYRSEGKISLAINFHKKSLELYKTYFGKDFYVTGYVYSCISLDYKDIQDYNQALLYIDSSITILEKKLPSNHPELAPSYNNKGLILVKKNDFAQAIKLFNKSLAITISQPGVDTMEIAGAYNNISTAYMDWEKFDSAKIYLEKSLSILNFVFGKNSPYHAIVFDNLAGVYEGQDKFDKAITESKLAINIAKLNSLPDLGNYYLRLAKIYNEKKDDFKSLQSVDSAISNYQRLGSDWNNELQIAIKFKKQLSHK